MNFSIIKSEKFRLILVAFVVFAFGTLTNYWAWPLAIALVIYLFWIFYQLEKLYLCLKKDDQSNQQAEWIGAIELIYYRIESNQKQKKEHYKKIGNFYSRFQKIIKNLPYATILISKNNEIEWLNHSAEVLLGLDREKDQGQSIDNLLRDPKIKRILKKQSHQEIEVNSPSSLQIKLAVQLIVISDNLKVLIARDISEYVHLQEVRKNFISNASHELRTPLTVISGYLEMLKIDKNLPKTYSKIITSSFEQSVRMKNIVEGLLTLSTLEGTHLEESRLIEKINMSYLLKPIIFELEKLQRAEIISTFDKSIGALGSKVEIISLCNNLIHNALIHNPKGTNVKVIWKKSNSSNNRGGAELIVKDDGIGIPSGDLPKITERFYKVKTSNQSSVSTGLGLAISSLIIQRHGLKLEIKSEINVGSEFKVIFPKNKTYKISKR